MRAVNTVLMVGKEDGDGKKSFLLRLRDEDGEAQLVKLGDLEMNVWHSVAHRCQDHRS